MTPSNPKQIFLTDRQVAARYGVGKATVWRWSSEGLLPTPLKLGLACTRWRLTDLEMMEAELDKADRVKGDDTFNRRA